MTGKKRWSRLVTLLSIIPFMIQAIPAVRAEAYFENASNKNGYAINELAGEKFYGILKVIEIKNHKKWYIPFETSLLKVVSASDEDEVIYDFNIMQTFNRHEFDNLSLGSKVRKWYAYQNNLNEEANNAQLLACIATLLNCLFNSTGDSSSNGLASLWAEALRHPRASLPDSRLALKLRKSVPSHDHDDSYYVSLSGLLKLPMQTQSNLKATSSARVRFTQPRALKNHRRTVNLIPLDDTIQSDIYHLTEIALFPSVNKNRFLYRSSDFIQRDDL